MAEDLLTYVQGDTGPNPVFALRQSSPTAGSTPRSLASLASAYIRWMQQPSGATAYVIPATIASGANATQGLVEGFVASVGNASICFPFASAGRFGAQVVLRGPWGVESWPRDSAFPVVVTSRMGSL